MLLACSSREEIKVSITDTFQSQSITQNLNLTKIHINDSIPMYNYISKISFYHDSTMYILTAFGGSKISSYNLIGEFINAISEGLNIGFIDDFYIDDENKMIYILDNRNFSIHKV